MIDYLVLPKEHTDSMIAHVDACQPEEGCGLLAGRGKKVELTISITNQFHSPVRYNMDPQELIKGFYSIEERNLDLLAIYHSHPNGPATPSAVDLVDYNYPETIMIILSKEKNFWGIFGFKIDHGVYKEFDLRIE